MIMMMDKYDIYKNLNIQDKITQNTEWEIESNMLYYKIDNSTIIRIHFVGYPSMISEYNISLPYKKKMVIRMVNSTCPIMYDKRDVIFEKIITQYSKDYFFVRKMRNILIEKNNELTLLDKERWEKIKDEKMMNEYKTKMNKIPKSFLRDSVIDQILEN